MPIKIIQQIQQLLKSEIFVVKTVSHKIFMLFSRAAKFYNLLEITFLYHLPILGAEQW